jgi:hypothetical protein
MRNALFVIACACGTQAPPLQIPTGSSTLVQIGDRIYAEPGLTDEDRRLLLDAHREAAARIDAVFGIPPGELAVTLFCRTPECKLAIDPELGASATSSDLGFARDGVTTTTGWRSVNVVVVTAPQLHTAQVLTHELVHATMKFWAPYDTSPTWFNEGLAVVIAGGPECPPPFDPAFDVTTLDTKAKWQAHLRRPGVSVRDTYCKARDAAAAWAAQYPEPAALGAATRQLLWRIGAGQPVSLKP